MSVEDWLRIPAFTWLETLWSKPRWAYGGRITHQAQDRWHALGKGSTVGGSSVESVFLQLVLDLFAYLVAYLTE